MFKDSVKCVPRNFQIKFFNEVLFLQLCCCMDLIAATRAEGGLVFLFGVFGSYISKLGEENVIPNFQNTYAGLFGTTRNIKFFECNLIEIFLH